MALRQAVPTETCPNYRHVSKINDGHCFKARSFGVDYCAAIDNHNSYRYLEVRCPHSKILKGMTLAFQSGSPHKAEGPEGDR